MVGWVKALLFLAGGAGAAAGTAYVTGALDPWLAPKPAGIAALPQTPVQPAPTVPAPQEEEAAPAQEEAAPPEAVAEDPVTTPKQERLDPPPVFDVLRVEPDGSVLVAGKAGANALVEVLSGDAVLGSSSAGTAGDFVVLLDDRLTPGDYRLALRATSSGDEAVLSQATAIVSIPESQEGQVLAMVEEPGAPAQLISVPQPEAPAETAAQEPAAAAAHAPETVQDEAGEPEAEQVAQQDAVEPEAAPAEAQIEAEAEAAPEAEPAEIEAVEQDAAPESGPAAVEAAAGEAPAPQPQPQPAAIHTVSVEAVEIEGDTIFVAGRADAGRTVRVYVGTVLLGDAVASEGGRFLVEAKRHLEVGNYLVRADLLGDDGSVVARAGVPFEREPGESIAAVAPPAPAGDAPAEAAGREDDEVAGTPAPEREPAAAGAGVPEAAPETEVATAPEPGGSEAAEEEATAPPLQRVDGAVIIRRGDSLWRISRRVYGHGVRYSTIYLANQDQIHDPNRIWPGQVFTVPGETPEGEQADLDAIGDQVVAPEDRESAAE